MNFLKKNIVFVGMLGVFILLLIGCFYMLNRKIEESKSIRVELDQKTEERVALWAKKPFPSEKNVELIQKNVKSIKELTDEALKILKQSSLSFESLRGTQCATELNKAARRMGERLNAGGIKIPTLYKFGFDRYLVAKAKPPEEEDTPMLQKQASVIEELVNLLAKSKISELVSIRRTEFEEERKMKPPIYNPQTDPLISSNGEFRYVDVAAYPYKVMPFEIVFKGDTDALRTFLNELSCSKLVFIPRIMTIDNEKKEAMTVRPAATTASVTAPGSAPAAPPKAQVPAGVVLPTGTALLDPERLPIVMGQENLSIGMRIEWFEFRGDKAKAETPRRERSGSCILKIYCHPSGSIMSACSPRW